ncbi:DUF4302 domain-containing protein [Aquimarina muelleri]|uniref:DUF4302 domain-containing protein n=1 Tax=Aquimarina muelleri TaxID=279356 RepID=A0A918JTS8_9FLAO|nr:DUF4302 domain-containing protein [Aquimarina muelleri]MCX2763602.1 DUF4302 domain-containing protein [Aquimarina muelleri]GGX14706.1 hypothetical protein GCM10007384_15390 [Aquimarina muelleri]
MLKNIKIYTLLLITLGFIACSTDNEVEPLFNQDIDTRVDTLLKSYKSTLTAPEFGWKVVYQPKNSVGFYNILLNFNQDNTVEIVSDYQGGTQDFETTYRVGKSHFPELVLENYSTFHNLFEVANFSLQAEFEFIFENVADNKIEFRSKSDKGEEVTKIVFEKAISGDKERIMGLRESFDEVALGHETNSFLRNIIVTDPAAAPTDPPIFSGTFSFSELDRTGIITTFDQSTGKIASTSYVVSISDTGFSFTTPFKVNGVDITTFSFVEADNNFISEDGNLNTIIGYNLAPVATALVPQLFSDDVDTFDTRFPRYLYFDDTSGNFLKLTSPDFLHLTKSINAPVLDIRMNWFGPDVHGIIVNGLSEPLTLAFNIAKIPGQKIVLQYLGSTNNAIINEAESLLNLLRDGAGWYVQQTNESRFRNNPSFSLTSVSFPNFRFSIYGI